MSNGSHALSYEKGITATDLASQTELIHLNVLPVATRLSTEKLHASLLGEQTQVAPQPAKAMYLAECPITAKVYYVNALGLAQQGRVSIDSDVNYTTSD